MAIKVDEIYNWILLSVHCSSGAREDDWAAEPPLALHFIAKRGGIIGRRIYGTTEQQQQQKRQWSRVELNPKTKQDMPTHRMSAELCCRDQNISYST